MSDVPAELKYTKSHEWVQVLGDGSVNIGITDHAQELLGDLVYVELPDIDRDLNAGEECAVVESVKAASDIYSPLSGKIIAVNDQLSDTPEIINQDAYNEGWIIRLQPSDTAELENLMDAAGYKAVAESE